MSKSLYSVHVVLAKQAGEPQNVLRIYYVLADSEAQARQRVGQHLIDTHEPRAVLSVHVVVVPEGFVLGSERRTDRK